MSVDRSRLPELGPDPAFHFPGIARHRLANGLDVRTVEHRALPVISLALLTRDGLGSDPAGREGLCALTTDMLDEGVGDLSAIDISDALARIGGDISIDIRDDATVLSLTTLARFADRGAGLLADLALRPALREADLARVRAQRINRLAQLKDMPSARGEQAFLSVVYGAHPYGHLGIGTSKALAATTLEDVRAFHAAAYRPGRATLVVTGDASHAELLAVAERAFGAWTVSPDASTRVAPADVPAPTAPSTRLALVHRDAAAQSILTIGQLAPPRHTPDYAALIVLNAVLGGQFVSRLNLKLREEKAYTYGAHTSFDWRRGASTFSMDTSVETKVTADAIADTWAEIDAIREARPATADELALAKASLTRGYARNFETCGQVARSVAQLALHDLADDYFERFAPMVEAVTAADVTRAAHTHLDPARRTTVVVGDREVVTAPLTALGLGAPTELGQED